MKYSFVALLAVFVLVGCGTKYIKGDINDIKYAEPTEEAKAFDYAKHLESLPPIEYSPVDYDVSEKVTYDFNGYSLTVDLPIGWHYNKRPSSDSRRLVKSRNLKDSCYVDGDFRNAPVGPCEGQWAYATINSDDALCLSDSEPKLGDRCNGVLLTPKGLRHGFGVRMAMQTRNPRLVQKLLGHSNLETTAIYMDLVGEEARAEVVGAW